MASRQTDGHGRVVEPAGNVYCHRRFLGCASVCGFSRGEVIRDDVPASAMARDRSMASGGRSELAKQPGGIGGCFWTRRLVAKTGGFEIGIFPSAGEAPPGRWLWRSNRGVRV